MRGNGWKVIYLGHLQIQVGIQIALLELYQPSLVEVDKSLFFWTMHALRRREMLIETVIWLEMILSDCLLLIQDHLRFLVSWCVGCSHSILPRSST